MQKNKNYTPKRKMPTATKQWASPNLERREVEKRIYGERLRLTASAAFHDYRIIAEYDREINNKRTNCDLEISFVKFMFV